MADDIAITAGTGTTVATDDIGGRHFQRVKPTLGADGTAVDVSAGAGAVGTGVQRVTLGSDDPAVVALQILDNAIAGSEMQVDVVAALPAGTNAIGKLAANTGVDIGDVDILSIAAGDNNIGNVDVVTLPALPAGTNNIGDVDVLSVVPGTGATALGKAEDAAHTTGDVGVMVLAVRQDSQSDFGADGDYVPLSIDADGALRVAGGGGGTQYAEDAVHASGNIGTMALAVRQDSQVDFGADGDYVPLSIDADGALRVAGGGGGTQYTEDAAAAADPVGNVMIAVRRDTPSASEVSTDGDNVAIKANSFGHLFTAGTYKEDDAATSGDWGHVLLAVRRDAQASTSGASGDYEVLKVDGNGDLRIRTAEITTAISDAGSLAQPFVTVITTMGARPANNGTPYTANDAWASNAADTGGSTLTDAARVSGGSGVITDAVISISTAAAASLQGEIWLFNQAVTAINDADAFTLTDAEALTCVGIIPFTTNRGATLNSLAHVQGLSIGFTCVGTANLRFLVKVINAYIPPSNSEILSVMVKIAQA